MSRTEKMLGKAGRLSYIIPTTRPYVTALWGALAGAKTAREQGRREAPPNRVPAKRFAKSAAWLLNLLCPEDDSADFPLEQIVCISLPPIDPRRATVFFDASPWGMGAVLWRTGVPTEFLELSWTEQQADSVKATIGQPKSQTTFEYLALYLVLRQWGDHFWREGFAILGDNVASLSCAVSFKGKGALCQISREIAWRKVRRQWRYIVAHVPSEQNQTADALSRTAAPRATTEERSFPAAALKGATRVEPARLDSWWHPRA